MNCINITGRLTREVERRTITTANTEVVKFTIAVDGGKDETYFFECECWDDLAMKLWENVKKGDKVGITGKLVQYKFQRRDGTNASAVKIVCQRVEYLSPKHKVEAKEEQPEEKIVDEIDAMKVLTTGNTYNIDRLYTYKQQLENELLTDLGIDNVGGIEKKEHLMLDEDVPF